MWLDEDQDAVLGYLRERRQVCPSCSVHDEDKPHVTTYEYQCPTCEMRDLAREALPEGEKGWHVTFEPLTVAIARSEAEDS